MTHYHRISLLFSCKENNMSVDQPSQRRARANESQPLRPAGFMSDSSDGADMSQHPWLGLLRLFLLVDIC